MTIGAPGPGALWESVERQAAARSGEDAYLFRDGRRVTFGDLSHAARRCAGILRRADVQPSHRIALLLDDGPLFTAWYAGVQACDAIPIPLPGAIPPAEHESLLGVVRPHALVTAADPGALLRGRELLHLRSGEWHDARDAPGRPEIRGKLAPPDGLLEHGTIHLTYRGLGRPLGAIHTAAAHRAAATAFCAGTGLTAGERVLAVLPWANIFGFTANVLAPLQAGATVVLGHGLPAIEQLDRIQRHRVQLLFVVPAQALGLAGARREVRADLGSVDRAWAGGSPLGVEVVDRFRGATGVELLQGYGLTEAFVVCANPWDRPGARADTLGLPFPGYRARIVDEQGREVPHGADGELEIEGAAVCEGYFGDRRATEISLPQAGRLRTGDRARIDGDGHLLFRGWIKRITKVFGYAVDLAELEDAIRAHPAVDDVELDTFPDPARGFEIRATVRLRRDDMEPSRLRLDLLDRLAHYKIPRQWRTATGTT